MVALGAASLLPTAGAQALVQTVARVADGTIVTVLVMALAAVALLCLLVSLSCQADIPDGGSGNQDRGSSSRQGNGRGGRTTAVPLVALIALLTLTAGLAHDVSAGTLLLLSSTYTRVDSATYNSPASGPQTFVKCVSVRHKDETAPCLADSAVLSPTFTLMLFPAAATLLATSRVVALQPNTAVVVAKQGSMQWSWTPTTQSGSNGMHYSTSVFVGGLNLDTAFAQDLFFDQPAGFRVVQVMGARSCIRCALALSHLTLLGGPGNPSNDLMQPLAASPQGSKSGSLADGLLRSHSRGLSGSFGGGAAAVPMSRSLMSGGGTLRPMAAIHRSSSISSGGASNHSQHSNTSTELPAAVCKPPLSAPMIDTSANLQHDYEHTHAADSSSAAFTFLVTGSCTVAAQGGCIKQVQVHASSVFRHSGADAFPTPWLVYGQKVKSSAKIFVREITFVPAYALILFCSHLQVAKESGIVTVDHWLRLECTPHVAAIFLELRDRLDRLLKAKFKNPHFDIWEAGGAVISAILHLISTQGPVAPISTKELVTPHH